MFVSSQTSSHYPLQLLVCEDTNEGLEKFTFVSGHEHTLQYIENDDHTFIVSGSGSKTSPVGIGKGSLFASASVGYGILRFYEGGETWVPYYRVARDGKSAVEIYQKKIKEQTF